jgi:hypothetical protein
VYRLFGALSVLAGWASLFAGAGLALWISELFALGHVEGAPPPTGVYGMPGLMVFWMFIGATVLSAPLFIVAGFAVDESGRILRAAAAMAAAGVLLLPDELGRAFGLGLLCSAGFLAAGAWLIHKAVVQEAARASAIGSGPAQAEAPARAVTYAEMLAEPAAPTAPASPAAELPLEKPAGPARKTRKRGAAQECPWCSARIPAGSAECPSCHASLNTDAVGPVSISGVTEVSPELLAYARNAALGKKKRLLDMIREPDSLLDQPIPEPAERTAIQPPNADVRLEMRRIQLEIEAAGQPEEAGPQEPTEATEPPNPPEPDHPAA